MRDIEVLKRILEKEINRWTTMDSSEFTDDIYDTYGHNRNLYNKHVYRDISIVHLLENKIITFREAEALIEIY
jgi:hypothetical protein